MESHTSNASETNNHASNASETNNVPSQGEVAVEDNAGGKKRKRTSKVWDEMKKHEDESAECNHCHKMLAGDSSNGTSHLSRHLNQCKRRPMQDIRKYGKLVTHKSNDGTTTLTTFKFDQEESRRALTRFVVCGKQAFNVVEEPTFRLYLQTINPEVKPISRFTCQRDVLATYVRERNILIEDFGKAPGRICLTSDNWNNEHTKDEFMCITAHWIDKDWKIQKRIILFKGLTLPFTGVSLADEIATCLSALKIDEKLCSITLDNASYNDVMATCLKLRPSIQNNMLCGGRFFQVHCSCHILNLIVQVGLKKIDSVVDKIRDGMKYMKKSSVRIKKFYDLAAKSFHLNAARKLRTDVCIRWNSTYLMLDCAIYFRKVFDHWGQLDHNFDIFKLSNEEWQKVEIIHKFLKPFYDATSLFSATKTPTSNIYFKGVWKIHSSLIKASTSPPAFMSDMIMDMSQKFRKYWDEYNLLLSCAAVLDPRYKLRFVEYCFSKIYDDVDYHVESVRNTLFKLFESYKGNFSIQAMSNVGGCGESSSIGKEDVDGFEDYEQFLNSKSILETKKLDLQVYLDEQNLDLKADIDIIDFWNKSSVRWPELAALARDLLAIPISTVASESTFSLAKKVINPWRSSLSKKTIQALVCLEDWYRARGFSLGGSSILGTPIDDFAESDDEENDVSDASDVY